MTCAIVCIFFDPDICISSDWKCPMTWGHCSDPVSKFMVVVPKNIAAVQLGISCCCSFWVSHQSSSWPTKMDDEGPKNHQLCVDDQTSTATSGHYCRFTSWHDSVTGPWSPDPTRKHVVFHVSWGWRLKVEVLRPSTSPNTDGVIPHVCVQAMPKPHRPSGSWTAVWPALGTSKC